MAGRLPLLGWPVVSLLSLAFGPGQLRAAGFLVVEYSPSSERLQPLGAPARPGWDKRCTFIVPSDSCASTSRRGAGTGLSLSTEMPPFLGAKHVGDAMETELDGQPVKAGSKTETGP